MSATLASPAATVSGTPPVTTAYAAVTVTGFDATILNFVTITGNFGFQDDAAGLEVVANGASAVLSAGSFKVGVTDARLALVLNTDGTMALDASGTPEIVLGSFASVTASSVTVEYNSSTTDYSAGQTITVGGVSATLASPAATVSGTPPVTTAYAAVTVTGFDATILNFVTITGNFGFQDDAAGLEVVANGASAVLSAGSFKVGVTDASLALVLNTDGTMALDASGTPEIVLGSFASVTASSVTVSTTRARRTTAPARRSRWEG